MTTNKKSTTAATSRAPPSTRSRRMVQNFHLVWLDGTIDEVKSDDCRNSITKLRQVVNTVNTFTDVDECIDFINSIEQEKAFMICSGALGQTTAPVVHNKPHVSTICIFCGNKARHEKWAKEWLASYCNIGGVYYNMCEYSKALEILQKTLPANHPSLAISYNNISNVYDSIEEYSKALSSHEKALAIRQKILPANHPDLASTYNNLGGVYYRMNDSSKALSYFERALNIFQSSLPPNHPSIQTVKRSMKVVKKTM